MFNYLGKMRHERGTTRLVSISFFYKFGLQISIDRLLRYNCTYMSVSVVLPFSILRSRRTKFKLRTLTLAGRFSNFVAAPQRTLENSRDGLTRESSFRLHKKGRSNKTRPCLPPRLDIKINTDK